MPYYVLYSGGLCRISVEVLRLRPAVARNRQVNVLQSCLLLQLPAANRAKFDFDFYSACFVCIIKRYKFSILCHATKSVIAFDYMLFIWMALRAFILFFRLVDLLRKDVEHGFGRLEDVLTSRNLDASIVFWRGFKRCRNSAKDSRCRRWGKSRCVLRVFMMFAFRQ